MASAENTQSRGLPQGANDNQILRWVIRFLGIPVGQMLLFVVGSAIIMTLFALLIAVLFPTPFPQAPDRTMWSLVSRQLPGMIISGIAIGFVYSMIALGYTLVYGVLKFINFAHSEIFMFGSVVGFEVLLRMSEGGILTTWNPFLAVIFMVLIAMVLSGTLAVLVERIAYRPLRGAPRLVPLISAIGMSFLLADLVRAFEGLTRNAFNLTYPKGDLGVVATSLNFAIGETPVPVRITQIIIIVASILMLVLLNYFVNGTKLGRGIRAVSQDMSTASLMGINVNTMISLTFFLGGALGGAAGALFGLNVGNVNPFVGFIPGLKAFTAAVLGGIGNVTGALLGGLALGMIEQFLNGLLVYFPALGTGYTDIFTFLVLILVLIFRPNGILGERVDEKV
jgi:branched-chain amino acid transport system permease protein